MDPQALRTLKMDLEHTCALLGSVVPCSPHGTESYGMDGDQDGSFYDLNDQRGFEQQLDENPQDTTTHGVFSDWLREQGADRHADQHAHLRDTLGDFQPNSFGQASRNPEAMSELADRATGRAEQLGTRQAHNEAATAHFRAFNSHPYTPDTEARRGYHRDQAARHDQFANPQAYPEQNSRYSEYADYDLNEQRGFEGSLDENPLDSTLHGGYADWLQEHGAERHAGQHRHLHEALPEHQGNGWGRSVLNTDDPAVVSELADRASNVAHQLNTPEAHNAAAVANYRAFLAHNRIDPNFVERRHHANASMAHDDATIALRQQQPEQNSRYSVMPDNYADPAGYPQQQTPQYPPRLTPTVPAGRAWTRSRLTGMTGAPGFSTGLASAQMTGSPRLGAITQSFQSLLARLRQRGGAQYASVDPPGMHLPEPDDEPEEVNLSDYMNMPLDLGSDGQYQIQHDNSGVGHNWRNIDANEISANTRNEIAAEIMDGGNESHSGYRASNGQTYRWGPHQGYSAYAEAMPAFPHTAKNVGGMTHPAWASTPLPEEGIGYYAQLDENGYPIPGTEGQPFSPQQQEPLWTGNAETSHFPPTNPYAPTKPRNAGQIRKPPFGHDDDTGLNQLPYGTMPTFTSSFANLPNPKNPWVTPHEQLWHGTGGGRNYDADSDIRIGNPQAPLSYAPNSHRGRKPLKKKGLSGGLVRVKEYPRMRRNDVRQGNPQYAAYADPAGHPHGQTPHVARGVEQHHTLGQPLGASFVTKVFGTGPTNADIMGRGIQPRNPSNHPEARKFIQHLKVNPEDNTTRGVFADWLDEHGYPEHAEEHRRGAGMAMPGTDIFDRYAAYAGGERLPTDPQHSLHNWMNVGTETPGGHPNWPDHPAMPPHYPAPPAQPLGHPHEIQEPGDEYQNYDCTGPDGIPGDIPHTPQDDLFVQFTQMAAKLAGMPLQAPPMGGAGQVPYHSGEPQPSDGQGHYDEIGDNSGPAGNSVPSADFWRQRPGYGS